MSDEAATDEAGRGEPVFELDDYVPFYIRAIANRFGPASSRLYQAKFGVGLTEWSCLAALAKEQQISGARMCEISGYDKGLVSRALGALEAKGLVRTQSVKHHNRQRVICFTPAGRARYRKIRRLALVREQRLLEGLSDRQRADLLAALKILLRNAAALVVSEAASLDGGPIQAASRRPRRAARRPKHADS
jgi:DNA-binding MarR family transcriptional regulator